MPISPENRKLYPANWKEIRAQILARADSRCEGDVLFIDYQSDTGLSPVGRCPAYNGDAHPFTGSKVVLTIAHLDHDPTNNNPANLRALCQKCHNTYDGPHRAESRKRRRAQNRAQDLAEMEFRAALAQGGRLC